MIIPVHEVRVLQVVQCVRNVRQVNIAIAIRNGHFSAVNERRMPAQRFTGSRLRHPQPQIPKALLCSFAVEVRLYPVATLLIQVRVDVIFFPALDAGRKCARDDRTRDFYRTEAVTLGVRHSPHRHMQTGITGSPVGHQGEDNALFQGSYDIALRLKHLSRCKVGSVAEQVNAGRSVQLPLMMKPGPERAGFGLRLRTGVITCVTIRR